MSTMAIGEVASQTGVAVSAVRYYDEIGLISAAERVGGKRRFDPETVGRVSFVRRAQDAGFALEEIRAILDDEAGEWSAVVDAKLTEITQRRDRLDEMIALLTELRTCGCRVVADCRLIYP